MAKTVEVKQNGKTVKVPILKDGRVNFAQGYRRDRVLTKAPAVGSLVIRDRSNDRTLIKVTKAEGNQFSGVYVTPQAKAVKETKERSFPLTGGRPVFRARPSH